MNEENLTRAVLTQDGRVLIEQPDGSYRPAGSRTDWDRVRAMTDEEIEASAASDADALPLDEAFWRRPASSFPLGFARNTPACASTRTCWRGSAPTVPATRPASTPCCAPTSRPRSEAAGRTVASP
jgi:hypothetical protein